MATAALKFPRTSHLLDLGRATRDDLRMSDCEVSKLLECDNRGLVLTAEEKVDGANVGFFFEGDKLLAKNRSKLLGEEQQQFRQLHQWMDVRGTRLRRLLKERVLYGEWMALKHSIHYTRLPDYFLAFDLFDLQEKRFLCRRAFRNEVERANSKDDECYEPPLFTVPQVQLPLGPLSRDKVIKLCLETQSNLYDGLAEGIYLRWDNGDWLQHRAKLVNPWFQQTLDEREHWSKADPVKNRVDFTLQYTMS